VHIIQVKTLNQAEAAATAFFPRGFFAGLGFFSFCEASKAEVRARAAYKNRERISTNFVWRQEEKSVIVKESEKIASYDI